MLQDFYLSEDGNAYIVDRHGKIMAGGIINDEITDTYNENEHVFVGNHVGTYEIFTTDLFGNQLPYAADGQRRIKITPNPDYTGYTMNESGLNEIIGFIHLENQQGEEGGTGGNTDDPVDPNPADPDPVNPNPDEPIEEKPVEFTELKINLLNTEFKRVTAIVNKERVVDNTDVEGQLETLTGVNLVALKCRKLPTGDFNKFDWTKEISVAFEEFIAKEVFLYTYLLELVVVNSGKGTAKRLIVESSFKPEDFKTAITNERDCVTKYMYLEEYLAGENIAKIIKPKLTFRANPSSLTFQENVKTIELNPKVRGKIVPNDAEEVVAQLQEALTNTVSDVAMIKRSDFIRFADVIDEDLNRIRIS